MKKITTSVIFIPLILLCCTKEDIPEAELTVKGFYNYCAAQNTKCGNTLRHEGSYVSITGYIKALNTFANDGRFHIFDSASMSSQRVEIKVNDNNSSIFYKLNKNLDYTNIGNFSKFKVIGKIIIHDLPINGACIKGGFLEISNSEEIIAIHN